MSAPRSIVSSAKLIAVCTLLSRVTGLLRDILLAQTFGLNWINDAFVYAFAIPNLFRRLFGEGAMAPAFVPTFTKTLENEGRPAAWRLLAHTLALLTVTLTALIILIAFVVLAIWLFVPVEASKAGPRGLLLALTALMLPYMLFVCVLALLSSILNCLGSFGPAALAPIVLNVCMITALAGAGPAFARLYGLDPDRLTATLPSGQTVRIESQRARLIVHHGAAPDAPAQTYANLDALTAADPDLARLWSENPQRLASQKVIVYTTALAVVVAGILQVLVLLPALRQRDVPLGWQLTLKDPTVRHMLRLLGPVALGQGVLAFGVFLDVQLCKMLTHVDGASPQTSFLGLTFAYPLHEGALAALTNAQRLYQFPLGVLVVSLATAALPAFSRMAARGEWEPWAAEVRQSLRLAVFEGILAGALMIVLAEPLVRLLFQRAQFTADDTARVAHVVLFYGLGLWAFCAQHIVLRAFYSTGNVRTPLTISVVLLPLNVALSLLLVWLPPIREAAFAISTTVTSGLSVIIGLIILARQKHGRIFDAPTAWALARMLLAGALAAAAVLLVQQTWTDLSYTVSQRLLGRPTEIPSLLGHASETPSLLGRTTEIPSLLGRTTEIPSLLGRTIETFGLLGLGAVAFLALAWLLRLHEVRLLLLRRRKSVPARN